MALSNTERSIHQREQRSRAAYKRRVRDEEKAVEEALEIRAEAEDVEEVTDSSKAKKF